jgi:hypothetical protein
VIVSRPISVSSELRSTASSHTAGLGGGIFRFGALSSGSWRDSSLSGRSSTEIPATAASRMNSSNRVSMPR